MDNQLTMYSFKAKWIRFMDVTSDESKTKMFIVLTKENSAIGEIKWYSPFRKYSFFPLYNTVYEERCLTDVAAFLNILMQERKNKIVV